MQHFRYEGGRRGRVQDHAGLAAELADTPEHAVQVDRRRRLCMDQDVVGAGPHEVVEVALGLDDHEVHVQRLGGGAAHCLDHHRPDANVGNEAAVHDVDVNPVGTRGVDRANLLGQAAEVGGEDRRGDDERLH